MKKVALIFVVIAVLVATAFVGLAVAAPKPPPTPTPTPIATPTPTPPTPTPTPIVTLPPPTPTPTPLPTPTPTPIPVCFLIMQANGNGTTDPAGNNSYPCGSYVNITAIPAPGGQFYGWTGDAVADSNSATTIARVDRPFKTVIANFAPIPTPFPTCHLTMQVNGSGRTSPLVGESYYNYPYPSVDIAAIPAPGWRFASWTGDPVADPNSTDTTVIICAQGQDTTVTANFALIPTPAPPVLVISPASGPPGTIAMLSGSGFCAADTIQVGGITLAGLAWNPAAIYIDSAGNWNTTLAIPPNVASGTCQVVATSGGGHCGLPARAWFTVTGCQCVPAGFHAHYAFSKDKSGDLQDTGVDVGLPEPSCPKGWHVIQILVKH